MISGVNVALITPLHEDRTVDEDSLREAVALAGGGGVDGIFANSSVGESAHFGVPEACRVLEVVAGARPPGARLYAGVTATASDAAVALGLRARDLGYDGLVTTTPYFYRPGPDAVVTYVEHLTSAVELPVVLYNVPLFAPAIDRPLLERLLAVPAVAAVKESTGSYLELVNTQLAIERCGRAVSLLVGREELHYAARLSGVDGCMVATAGIVPEAYVRLDALVAAGRLGEAWKLQQQLVRLVNACFGLEFPLGFKLALRCRLPAVGTATRRLTPAADLGRVPVVAREIAGIVEDVLTLAG